MSEEKTTVYLDSKEAELFKRFCQFHNEWEKFFDDEFVGSITLNKGKFNPDVEVEWRIKKSYSHIDLTNPKK